MKRLHGKTSLMLLAILTLGGCKTASEVLPEPTKVVVERVGDAVEQQSFSYSGTIEESETIPLSFTVVGSVARVLVSEGDFVKKGQLLAELNDESYKNAYAMASATLKQAEDAYKRLLPMYQKGNLPEMKFVEVETGVQKAKAAAEVARKNVDDCKLFSPVSGIVGKRTIEPGMNALPNLATISIVKIDKVFARVPVPENEISSLKKGAQARISIAALDCDEFTGVVEGIGVLADPVAHTYKIKIAIENRNLAIKPGMICSVLLSKPASATGLVVPSRAVMVDERGRNFVYVVDQDKALRKYVEIGDLFTDAIEIMTGLNRSDIVVVLGQHNLADGSAVHIVNK